MLEINGLRVNGDLQHSLPSVHEKGALCVQLPVLEKDFGALSVLLLSFGEQREREKRAVGKYFNSWPPLVQDLALRGQRQAVYLLFLDTFGGSESPWACYLPLSMLLCSEDTTLTPHVDVSPSACGAGGCEGSAEDGVRHPGEEHSGELITHHWAGGQLFHIMKACSMSRDAPVLASCQEDSCPESWHQIQVISEQLLGFRAIKWSLPALPCPPWQHFLEPSVTEEQKLDPAVAWWFHPLQPNRRFGLDAPTAQWE